MTEDQLDILESQLAAAETAEQVSAVELQIAILLDQSVGTLAEVAELFGVGVSTLWAWRGGSNPMPGYEGHWRIREISEWVAHRRANSKRGGDSEQSAEKAALEVERLRSTVDLLECKFHEMAGGLVRKSAIVGVLKRLEAEAVEVLTPIPALLAERAPEYARDTILNCSKQQIALTARTLKARFAELRERLAIR